MDSINEDVDAVCIDILDSIDKGLDNSIWSFRTGRKAKITIMKELLKAKMFLDHNIIMTINWKRDKKDNEKYILEFNYWYYTN